MIAFLSFPLPSSRSRSLSFPFLSFFCLVSLLSLGCSSYFAEEFDALPLGFVFCSCFCRVPTPASTCACVYVVQVLVLFRDSLCCWLCSLLYYFFFLHVGLTLLRMACARVECSLVRLRRATALEWSGGVIHQMSLFDGRLVYSGLRSVLSLSSCNIIRPRM